jgi:hypothetical protein
MRHETPIRAAEKWLIKGMEVQDKARARVVKWEGGAGSRRLTKFAKDEFIKFNAEAKTCKVVAAGEFKAYVTQLQAQDQQPRLVDFSGDHGKCSCTHWQQTDRPCTHALAAVQQKVSPRGK